MATDAVHYGLEKTVAVVRLDDGKANALSPALIAAIQQALDRAERDARALLLVGRPGRFSGGFDLTVMRQGREAVRSLVTAGAELALRLYGFPRPVVVACTGHAIAMGALLLLCADSRLGTEGDFRIGLNETANGMTLPVFGVELARDRLSKRHLARATLTAEMYAPAAAVDAGYLDCVAGADVLLPQALAEAERLSALDSAAFARTKRRLRTATIVLVRETLARDMDDLAAGE
jgi:enoyl-CoA hydratase